MHAKPKRLCIHKFIIKTYRYRPMGWYGFIHILFEAPTSPTGQGDEEKREGIQEKKSYTTPRTLLALMRLSQVVNESFQRVGWLWSYMGCPY